VPIRQLPRSFYLWPSELLYIIILVWAFTIHVIAGRALKQAGADFLVICTMHKVAGAVADGVGLPLAKLRERGSNAGGSVRESICALGGRLADWLGSYEPKEVQTFRAAIEKFKLWKEPKDCLG